MQEKITGELRVMTSLEYGDGDVIRTSHENVT